MGLSLVRCSNFLLDIARARAQGVVSLQTTQNCTDLGAIAEALVTNWQQMPALVSIESKLVGLLAASQEQPVGEEPGGYKS